jgi:hypothetical protein
MVGSVFIGKFLTLLTEVFFHEWVDDYFLSNSVAGYLPSELARPTFLSVGIAIGFDIMVVIFVHLSRVMGLWHAGKKRGYTHLLVVLSHS